MFGLRGWYNHAQPMGRTWIPYAVVGIGVFTTFLMLGVLGREGLGPWSGLARQETLHNEDQPPLKRSLDADEEA